MSSARRKVWQKEVTRRLSGADVKVRRYTPGDNKVQTNDPSPVAVGEERIGRVKRVLDAILETLLNGRVRETSMMLVMVVEDIPQLLTQAPRIVIT